MKEQRSIIKWGILGLFFISGVPALLYQIIWQHHLYTIYGAHAESVAIIVGAFMLGLGLGSLIGGEVSVRWKRSPFYLFAIVEMLIGVFGYFSLPLFDAVGKVTTHVGVFGAGMAAFALILIPTIAMGATLPILANALIRRIENVGVSVGHLYFVNTLGSACAALGSLFLFSAGLGQHGVIAVAVLLNLLVALGSLILRSVTDAAAPQEDAEGTASSAVKEESNVSRTRAMILSFCSGFLALSVEIIWFRIVFLSTNGRAFAFPISLGFFLFGIAFGSFYAARLLQNQGNQDRQDNQDSQGSHADEMIRRLAAHIILISGCVLSLAYLLIGITVTSGAGIFLFLMTAFLAFPLGLLFPLLMHSGVLPDRSAGRSVSYIYAANILGSTLGSLGTGFLLLEYLTMREIVFLLSSGTIILALMLCRRPLRYQIFLGVGCALFLICLSYRANDLMYEKLQFLSAYVPGTHFAHVVENRSGVVAVTEDKVVYGTGVYDGHYSTDLENDKNGIVRPFALSAFRAAPKHILVIGLSSGSWAQVLANHPDDPEVDIIEINPAYLKLIPEYGEVASLLTNPRVKVTIMDGRRYLMQHPEKTYDAIVMNTSYFWRAGATNLLSREFLNILRAHLTQDGLLIYNTTDSRIVYETGFTGFNYGWRLANTLVLSDSPLPIDRERLLANLSAYRIDGKPVLDLDTASGKEAYAKLSQEFDPAQHFSSTTLLETRASMLSRLSGVPILTDDNMLIEWGGEVKR